MRPKDSEIGIRIALGAQGGEVRGMSVRQGAVLTTLGVAAGLAVAVALTRSMSSLLFGVTPVDPVWSKYSCGTLVIFEQAAESLAALNRVTLPGLFVARYWEE